MKVFLFISLFFFSCAGEPVFGPAYAVNYTNSNTSTKDTLLKGIEGKIYNSFVQSLTSKSEAPIQKIDEALEALYKEPPQNLIIYWRAYNHYYQAIYYIQSKDAKQSEKAIDKAVELMKSIDNKNAEDYALLAMSQSFSIQFKGMQAMFISGKVSKNIDRALVADKENLRAWFVAGSSDYYTPEKYGGGKKVEEFLKKAISLPAQKIQNEYLPSWGKEEAYEMLIKFYLKKDKKEEATATYKSGIAEFPNSYLLNQLASKLI